MRELVFVSRATRIRCLSWRMRPAGRESLRTNTAWQHLRIEAFDTVHDQTLRQAARELELEPRLSRLFLPTSPLWYGFWARSPLSATQADCLSQLFRTVNLQFDNHYDTRAYESLIQGLGMAATGQIVLEVEIQKPTAEWQDGEVTRPYCPRCRWATPDIDPWTELSTWPATVGCRACGCVYAPTITYSPVVEGAEGTIDQIVCTDCKASMWLEDFDESQQDKLWELLELDRARQAWAAAQRWHEFFLDYPDWETRWLPDVAEGLRIDAPEQLAELEHLPAFGDVSARIVLQAQGISAAEDPYLLQLRARFESTPATLHDAIIQYETSRDRAQHCAMICPECDGALRGVTGLPRCSPVNLTL